VIPINYPGILSDAKAFHTGRRYAFTTSATRRSVEAVTFLHRIGLVTYDDRLRNEPDEDIIPVVQYLHEPGVSVFLFAQVSSQQPPHPISVIPLQSRPPAEPDVLNHVRILMMVNGDYGEREHAPAGQTLVGSIYS